MKKTLAVVLAVSIAALLFASCGSNAKTDTTTKESWLFSLQSGGTTGFDQSTGVLSVPVGNLVGFTDRPNRVTRALTPTEFAALWADRSDDSFNADPPNASLTYWDSDATTAVAHTAIVEITGNVTNTGNVLSMTLRILSPSGAVLPTKMYRASLFIDDDVPVAPDNAYCEQHQKRCLIQNDWAWDLTYAPTPAPTFTPEARLTNPDDNGLPTKYP